MGGAKNWCYCETAAILKDFYLKGYSFCPYCGKPVPNMFCVDCGKPIYASRPLTVQNKSSTECAICADCYDIRAGVTPAPKGVV